MILYSTDVDITIIILIMIVTMMIIVIKIIKNIFITKFMIIE